jgi:flagellar assembly factor FliW
MSLAEIKSSSETYLKLKTRFGEFEADSRHLLNFPEGLPGFEGCRRFLLLSSPETAPLQCLHAVDGPAASFLVLDPKVVLPQYRCVLNASDLKRFNAAEGAPLLWLAIVTIDAAAGPTANLRAPIVIDPAQMLGYQVMPHSSLYPLRHPLPID